MGSSTKKHKKDSKKKKHRSRSRSISIESRDRDQSRQDRRKHKHKDNYRSRSKSPVEAEYREHGEERRHRHKVKKHKHRRRDDVNVTLVRDSDESSSDCIEVPLAAPPAPIITRPSPPSKGKSPSPENAEGAGDVISIEETNRIRAKLGLKPLEVSSGPIAPSSGDKAKNPEGLLTYKDDWGEFLHKPADDLAEKAEVKKIREKLVQKKEKRKIEEKLLKVKTLGESDEDDDVDDAKKWVASIKKKEELQKEAQKRAKLLEEMDVEFGSKDLTEKERRKAKPKVYKDKDLAGLTVDHDIDDFQEGRSVILTLRDKDVLDEEDGDTLVNVNMIDDEKYKKNVENKKLHPQSYGYDVYEEQYDEFGNPLERDILGKYNDEIGKKTKKNFTLGESLVEEIEQKRKLLEIKTKLAGKRLETLDDVKITLASDTFSEHEIQAKFKKPKRKVKKLRQKLKASDLVPLASSESKNFGSRRHHFSDDEDMPDKKPEIKLDPEDDDLEKVLSKARRIKQKEGLIQKALATEDIKVEVKEEPSDDLKEHIQSNMMLNSTAEFCRTLGDIPTYGMAGNRDEITNDMMDFEMEADQDIVAVPNHLADPNTGGTWNSVDPQFETRGMDEVVNISDDELSDVAILDEEPDVGTGIGNALRLAMSKGYLEKEDQNRPSNTKMAHLQAKNYSIEDKSYTEDDKFNRRDRYQAGPIMDFRDKSNFNPNVKLEYIDDNGRILNAKEAFRYLSHKFHGKGPGKNKIEKRLKKMEQEGLMKTMSSTDTPLGTLTMLQQKQKETKQAFVVLSGGKQATMGSISKNK